GQPLQNSLAVALSSGLRQDEQVFQVDPCPAQKGGEIMEKQGKAHFPAARRGQQHLRLPLIENPFLQGGFVRHNFVGHFFVLRKSFDKLQDQGDVFPLSPSKGQ